MYYYCDIPDVIVASGILLPELVEMISLCQHLFEHLRKFKTTC